MTSCTCQLTDAGVVAADVKEITIGPYRYTRRDYTPKRRGETAGHGWIREAEHRAEVGLEARVLIDALVAERQQKGINSTKYG